MGWCARQVGRYNNAGGQLEWDVLPHAESPAPPTYAPRRVFRALLGGHHLTDVSIQGGTIDGGGEFWYDERFCRRSL